MYRFRAVPDRHQSRAGGVADQADEVHLCVNDSSETVGEDTAARDGVFVGDLHHGGSVGGRGLAFFTPMLDGNKHSSGDRRRTATASTTGWHGTAPHRKGNSQDAPSSRPSPPEGSSHHRTTRCSPIPTGFSEHRVAARVPGLGNGPHARTARRATGRHSFTGVYPCGIPAFATVPPCLRGLLARLDSHASLHLPPRCRGSGPPEEGPPTIRNG